MHNPGLPLFLGLLFIALSVLPQGFSLMNFDGKDHLPWYTPFTTLLYISLIFLVYPTTVAAMGIGGWTAVGGPVHFLLVLFYCDCFASLFARILKPKTESQDSDHRGKIDSVD